MLKTAPIRSKLKVTRRKSKPKRKTIAGLVEEAAALLQRIRRLEEADENGNCRCVSCGTVGYWKMLQGGHYIPRGKTATKLVEHNINPQCVSCNHFRKEEAKCRYAIWMIETYGYEYVKWLEAESRKEKKYTRPEIEEIICQFKQRLKELEA